MASIINVILSEQAGITPVICQYSKNLLISLNTLKY
nr:MAG TPA: hypothetical protein [Caudoviricetes sp.]